MSCLSDVFADVLPAMTAGVRGSVTERAVHLLVIASDWAKKYPEALGKADRRAFRDMIKAGRMAADE